MNGGKPRGLLLAHPTRHAGTQIATLRDVTAVTQTLHQDRPGSRDARKAPPSFGRFVRKPEPGKRGDYAVKGFIGFTPTGRRDHKRSDDLQKLEDRSSPAMSADNWQGAFVLYSRVN